MQSPRSAARIAILAPMKSELRPLVSLLALKPSASGDGSLLHSGFGGADILATTTGIGMRRAAHKAEMILDTGVIHHLIVVGIAGGVGPSVAIGDLVVPELVIDLATRREFHPNILAPAEARGSLATSDDVPIDLREIDRLERRGVIAVDMETAAIAAVCERRKCPWSVFRAISDRADDGTMDAAIFGLSGPEGDPNISAILRFAFTKPRRLPQLARLARGANLAANTAAAAVVDALRSCSIS